MYLPPLVAGLPSRLGWVAVHCLPIWCPSSPDLYGCHERRETPAHPASSREMRGSMPPGVSDALASATCGDLCAPLRVSDASRQRRDGGQASYFLFQSYCATQSPDLRTSSWSATQAGNHEPCRPPGSREVACLETCRGRTSSGS